MIEEARFPAVQLSVLTEAMCAAEEAHHQNMMPFEDLNHGPMDCSCGVSYRRETAWEESKAHMREVMAQAMLAALHRPCESCLGSGLWEQFRATFECPECEGRGRTLAPLPPMTFQDDQGVVWMVDGFEAENRLAILALVHQAP